MSTDAKRSQVSFFECMNPKTELTSYSSSIKSQGASVSSHSSERDRLRITDLSNHIMQQTEILVR